MALFARRDIQKSLEALATILPTKDIGALVNRLNRGGAESIAAEWEGAFLAALSAVGELEYEPQSGGETRPDVRFLRGDVQFVADVRTVSDGSIEDKNPVALLWEEIFRTAESLGLSGAGLTLEVGSHGCRTGRLLLPPKGEVPNFVRRSLKPFLGRVAAHPGTDDTCSVSQAGVQLVLRYDSKERRFSRGQWMHYSSPQSPVRNPLFNALKAKADQLRSSGWRGLRGIIVCDGDCVSLQDGPAFGRVWGSKEIVAEFFKRHQKTVSFVVVFEVRSHHQLFPPRVEIGIRHELFWNPRHPRGIYSAVEDTMNAACKGLPRPVRTPANALAWLKSKKPGTGASFYGGYAMKGPDEIRISARALVELLAGRLEQKRFLEDHGFLPTNDRPQAFPFFERKCAEGKTLQSVDLERSEHEDDDWVVLRFGGPDPAISPFRVPG